MVGTQRGRERPDAALDQPLSSVTIDSPVARVFDGAMELSEAQRARALADDVSRAGGSVTMTLLEFRRRWQTSSAFVPWERFQTDTKRSLECVGLDATFADDSLSAEVLLTRFEPLAPVRPTAAAPTERVPAPAIRRSLPPAKPPAVVAPPPDATPTSVVAEAAKWYGLVIPAITFAGAAGFQLVPGGKLKAEDLAFTQVMASTWPLALAVVTITLLSMHKKEVFAEDADRWLWLSSLGILVVAGFVGCGAILESIAAPEDAYELPGHPAAALAYLALAAIGAFLLAYGPVLFLISVGMSIWAAWWIEEQRKRHVSS